MIRLNNKGLIGSIFIFGAMILFLLALVTIIIYSDIQNEESKSICIDKGFEDGNTDAWGDNMKIYTIRCYDHCFNSTEGLHRCNNTYFKVDE